MVADVEALAAAALKDRGASAGPVVDAAPRARAAKPKKAVDPVQLGFQRAKELLAEEHAEKLERQNPHREQRDRYGRRVLNDGPKKPVAARRRRIVIDFDETRITNSKGEPAGKAGYVTRWVRTHDHAGREISARLAEFKAYGYEPIVDPHTGEPIKSHLGIAVQATPEAYGERILHKSKEGAFNRDELLENTYAALDALNEAADGDVAGLVVDKRHGRKRVRERIADTKRGEVGEYDAELEAEDEEDE